MSGKNDSLFMWSGNWCVENELAWFVPGECNAIFQLDMRTNQCNFIVELPNNRFDAFTFNFYCIKCDHEIYCMPYVNSDSIWVYQLDDLQFQQIKVANAKSVQNLLLISEFWKYGEKIYAVSRSLKQILEINIREKEIENYYNICGVSTEEIAQSIKVGQVIYSVSASTNKVYQFDIENKKTEIYTIPNVEERIYAIAFDGKNFWITGFSKKIFVWNKENNTVVTIDKFPEQFGIYNFENDNEEILDCKSFEYATPIFISIIALEREIWFIPLRTNKIIYVNKDTFEIGVFEIEDENETKSSLLASQIKSKYALQHVKDERYIELFSYKNNWMIEIDTLEKTFERKIYSFNNICLKKLVRMYEGFSGVYQENRGIERLFFKQELFNGNQEGEEKLSSNVGANIHSEMMLLST